MPSTAQKPREALSAPQPLAVALWLAGQGFHVHPLLPGRKTPPRSCVRCTPGSTAEPNSLYIKHTHEECRCIQAGLHCHGVRAATTDPDKIQSWWGKTPTAGVGVAAGPSGLLILDVDRHGGDLPETSKILPGLDLPDGTTRGSIHDGLDVLALLCEVRNAPLLDVAPGTLTTITPSGGRHYWYRVPHGTTWKSGSSALGWQLDVKAGWGYAIAPGTVTTAGIYQADGPSRTVADLPAWLAADLKRTGHQDTKAEARPRVSAARLLAGMRPVNDNYVATAVRAEVQQLAQQTEGGRNAATFKAAARLGRFIPSGKLSESEVENLILAAAQSAGLPEREAISAVRSGIRSGVAKGEKA
ncbi:bifunctional DNA primase/polymerase [Streptomyces sp. NPDC048209]|uniref:bifunctional DNA primase/polymerase n=1 Tax=Streptomyces TaxID=1883 RepID=UPI003439A4DE